MNEPKLIVSEVQDTHDDEDEENNDEEILEELASNSNNAGASTRKRGSGDMHASAPFSTRGRIEPLSILDNIDTLRRGLMRELALRRLAQDRREMVKTSEFFKQQVGKRK